MYFEWQPMVTFISWKYNYRYQKLPLLPIPDILTSENWTVDINNSYPEKE